MQRLTIAVGGGKGGVGKSLVSLNLAVALAQRGQRVVLVDADLGGANLHTLLGVDTPERTLGDFVRHDVDNLQDVVLPTLVPGLGAVLGGTTQLGDANPRHAQKLRLIRHLGRLDADVVVTDVGAGTAYNELDLFNAAMLPVIVFSPQVTAVQNAYVFAKAALYRHIGQALGSTTRALVDQRDATTAVDTIADLLGRVEAADHEAAERVRLLLDARGMYVVGNMARREQEKEIFNGIVRVIHDQLGLTARLLGALSFNFALERSVNARRPFMVTATPGDPERQALDAMAVRVLAAAHPDSRTVPPVYAPVRPRVVVRLSGRTFFAHQVLRFDVGGITCSFSTPLPLAEGGHMLIGPVMTGERAIVKVVVDARTDQGYTASFTFVDPDEEARENLAELATIGVPSTAA